MSQLNEPINAEQIAAPVLYSHAYDELEQAMAQVFTQMIGDNLLNDLDDMFNYGTPQLGSRTLVERFTKLNGLAVLRRNDSGFSDKLMAIILANWQALASERGLAFVQFVLDMLYPHQNKIIRLWHSKAKANLYPNYVTETQGTDRFLTSRVRIKLDSDIDIKELAELAPVFRRLVPWQIVPEIAIDIDTQDQTLGMAIAADKYHVGDFSPF